MKTSSKALCLGLGVVVCGLFANGSAYADYIYVSNYGDGTIEKFDQSGNGTVFASGLNKPAGLAFDSSGDLFVANSGNNTIERFDSSGNESVFASTGLNTPTDLAFDGSGNLYALNRGDHTLEKFDPSGNGSLFATIASVFGGMVGDGSGNLYLPVYDPPGSLTFIDKFDSSGQFSVFAKLLEMPLEPMDGCLGIDSSGNLYVATVYFHSNTSRIKKIAPNGSVSLFSNSGLAYARSLVFGSNGNLYAANWGNNTIEKFDTNGNSSVFADSGLSQPWGIAIQVPEPATCSLLALGVLALLGTGFHRRSS